MRIYYFTKCWLLYYTASDASTVLSRNVGFDCLLKEKNKNESLLKRVNINGGNKLLEWRDKQLKIDFSAVRVFCEDRKAQ